MTDRALQRMIFAACKQLGLDDDARRDMQLSVTNKSSMSDMTDADLKLVVNRLKESGFKSSSKAASKPGRKLAPRKDLRFIHVLWRELGAAEKLRDPSRAGLNAFIRRRFGASWGSVPRDVDDLRDHDKISDVIDALKSWNLREDTGFDPNELN